MGKDEDDDGPIVIKETEEDLRLQIELSENELKVGLLIIMCIYKRPLLEEWVVIKGTRALVIAKPISSFHQHCSNAVHIHSH